MRTLRHSHGGRSDRGHTLAALVVALALVAGCQSSVATSAPTDGRSPTVSTSLPTQPLPTSSARSTPEPTAPPSGVAARWEPAGTVIGDYVPHAALLGDGRVLVVWADGGYDDIGGKAELWDPATGAWHTTEGLNKPRTGFAAVPLADGRVLVIGGLNQDEQSFSSTYIYDPVRESWTKAGLLGTARTAPAAAVLPDGHVFVAGGYFHTGLPEGRADDPGFALAAYRPGSAGTGQGRPPLNDVDFGPLGYAFATAELFDPASETWSPTGPMNYARVGAAAVTLADGRILVVGSSGAGGSGRNVTRIHPDAYETAEIYDPRTGRFTLAGRLPDIHRKALKKLGVPLPKGDPEPAQNGTLVALDDGGALLMGHAGWWKHEGDISRSFRFEPATGQWSEIGQPSAVTWDNHPPWGVYKTPGALRFDALVAGLPDGRVLVAGGADAYQESGTNTPTAELYDPVSNAWSPLPPMPEARAGGATVVLKDGSVLLVGGFDQSLNTQKVLTSAVRFIPSQ